MIMKIVADAAAASSVTTAASAVVVVVIPEVVVLGGAMGRCSATMLNSHPQKASEVVYDDSR